MNILITGGAGFIGSHLCEKLLKNGNKVIALDMNNGEKVEHLKSKKSFQFVQGSVLDRDLMEKLVSKSDMIFHLAAIADPKRYVTEPLNTLEINLRATINMLSMVAQKKIKIIYASSSEIYGKNPSIPWKEDADRVLGSTKINRWCYSSSKAAIEHYFFAYGQQMGLPFVIVRIFNAYGPRLDDLGSGRVIPVFLEKFLNNKPVEIHNKGKQTRCFTYVTDIIDGIYSLSMCKKAEGEVFNIGSNREMRIVELAKLIKKIGKFSSPIKFISYKEAFGDKYEDIQRRVPDTSKIKRFIGWGEKVSLEMGLKLTIDYYKKSYSILSR